MRLRVRELRWRGRRERKGRIERKGHLKHLKHFTKLRIGELK